ncbi:hypothetical protein ILP92_13630 [Maribius pontilimi]|uniref:Uncharacterized protein n=1 Tax=Palleronia pontilimi TaxID=1964209 RepID=A0A934IB13_9RHOB|nr:hypothetical protein [Palleronia pontilimi]MBJ3763793.1 hypothetical protein [Palleronia pontilimi]
MARHGLRAPLSSVIRKARRDGEICRETARLTEDGWEKIIGVGRDMDACHRDGARHFLGILHDLTVDRIRQAELQRPQKMEPVGQLPYFSKSQALAPEYVDRNTLLKAILPLLSRTLGIQVDLADDLVPTITDAGQIKSAILNLAINARDAMKQDGRDFPACRRGMSGDSSGCGGRLGFRAWQ